MLNQKNAKAYAVLAIVMDKMSDDFEEVTVEPYLNGRESGFAIWRYSSFESTKVNKVAFSEYRNGGLVVYKGDLADFSMQGNTPSDRAYGEAPLYGEYDYIQAADFIIKHLAS